MGGAVGGGLTDKGDSIRPAWSAAEFHIGLFGGAVAFFAVAGDTGADEVFPRIGAAGAFGNDVINRQAGLAAGAAGFATILTAMTVAQEQVAAIQQHSASR